MTVNETSRKQTIEMSVGTASSEKTQHLRSSSLRLPKVWSIKNISNVNYYYYKTIVMLQPRENTCYHFGIFFSMYIIIFCLKLYYIYAF